jgi:hypothetical protein
METGDVWRPSSRSELPRCVQVRRHGKRTAKPQLLVWRRHQALTGSGGPSSSAADREALQPSAEHERSDAERLRKRDCKPGKGPTYELSSYWPKLLHSCGDSEN